jgi:hypothetical protein
VELLLDFEGCSIDKCGKGKGIFHGAQQGHEAKENVFVAINVF